MAHELGVEARLLGVLVGDDRSVGRRFELEHEAPRRATRDVFARGCDPAASVIEQRHERRAWIDHHVVLPLEPCSS